MIVLVIILIILCLLMGLVIFGMHQYILKQIEELAFPELYPCQLYVLTRFNQTEESLITDFSLYEDQKIIFGINNFIGPPRNAKEASIEGKIAYFKNAVVYKYEGAYIWKL